MAQTVDILSRAKQIWPQAASCTRKRLGIQPQDRTSTPRVKKNIAKYFTSLLVKAGKFERSVNQLHTRVSKWRLCREGEMRQEFSAQRNHYSIEAAGYLHDPTSLSPVKYFFLFIGRGRGGDVFRPRMETPCYSVSTFSRVYWFLHSTWHVCGPASLRNRCPSRRPRYDRPATSQQIKRTELLPEV